MSERIIKFKNDSVGSMSLKEVYITPDDMPIKPIYNIDFADIDVYERYTIYHGDLAGDFITNHAGRSKSQYGLDHYTANGRGEGRELFGVSDIKGYIGFTAVSKDNNYFDIRITKSLWQPVWYPIKGSDGKAMMLYHVGKKANFIWHRTFTDWINSGSFSTNGPGVREWTKHAIDFLTRNKTGSRKILVYENVLSTYKYSLKLAQSNGEPGAFEEILEGDKVSYISGKAEADGFTEDLGDYDVIVIVGSGEGTTALNSISDANLNHVKKFCEIEGKGVLFMGDHDLYTAFPDYVSEHLFNEGILDKKIEYDGSATSAASNSPRFDDPQWQVFGDIFKDATGERYSFLGHPSLNGDFLGWRDSIIYFANWKDGYPEVCQYGKFVATWGGADHQWIDRRYYQPADGYWLQKGGSNSLDITFIPAEDFDTPLVDGRLFPGYSGSNKECVY